MKKGSGMHAFRRILVIAALNCWLAGTLPAGGGRACGAESTGSANGSANDEAIRAFARGEIASLMECYCHLHAHPELSLFEKETAARMADEWKRLGFEVTTGVGGHGVVALLKNGPGPTVMLRTDLDGLPVVEQTLLPYASKVTTRDAAGKEVGTVCFGVAGPRGVTTTTRRFSPGRERIRRAAAFAALDLARASLT